jgi:hypothetical protein
LRRLYPGQHPTLIDAETWTAVRDQLAANASRHQSRSNAAKPSLLVGLLVDARGERLTHHTPSRKVGAIATTGPVVPVPKDAVEGELPNWTGESKKTFSS